jgi:hypothetical protein
VPAPDEPVTAMTGCFLDMLGLPEEVRMKAKPRHFTRKGQAVVVEALKP